MISCKFMEADEGGLKENYLVINGVRIDLTDEQIRTLRGKGGEKKSPFDRALETEDGYVFNSIGEVWPVWTNKPDHFIEVGNYCTDKELLQKRADIEILNRLLWRFSMEHGSDEIDLRKSISYEITWNAIGSAWHILAHSSCTPVAGGIVFATKELALEVLNTIVIPFDKEHPDLLH